MKSKRSIHWILGAGLVAGGLWFDPLASSGFQLPKIAILQGVLGVVLLLLWRAGGSVEALWKTWRGRAVLAYGVLIIIYTIASVARLTSAWGAYPVYQGLLTQAIYFGAFLVALSSSRSLGRAFVALNLLVVFYGILQIVGLDPWQTAWDAEAFLGRTFSVLGNPNFLASFLLLTVPFLWIEIRNRNALLTATALNAAVLMSTASKAALVGLAVMLIAAGLLKVSNSKFWRRNRMAIGALLVVFLLAGWHAFQARYATDSEVGRSFGARQVIWIDTLELLAERPWGYGLDALGLVYPQTLSPELYEYESFTANIDRAHNFILDGWIATGPLGPLLLLFLIGATVFADRAHPEGKLIALGLLGYLTTLFFGFEVFLTHFLFWSILGYRLAQTYKPKSRPTTASRLALLIVALLLLILWPVSLQHWQADRAYARAEAELTRGEITEALTYYAQSIELYPNDRIYLLKATEVALVVLETPLEEATADQWRAFVEANLGRLDELTNDRDASTHLLRAWYHAIRGELAAFESELQRGIELSPNHPITYKIAHHIYTYLGDDAAAHKTLFSLVPLMPAYLDEANSDAIRIFWKENAWLSELLVIPDSSAP